VFKNMGTKKDPVWQVFCDACGLDSEQGFKGQHATDGDEGVAKVLAEAKSEGDGFVSVREVHLCEKCFTQLMCDYWTKQNHMVNECGSNVSISYGGVSQ